MFKLRSRLTLVTGLAALCLGFAQSASAAPIQWVDWTTATPGNPGSASGTVSGIGVSYAGEFFSANTAGGTDWWACATCVTTYTSPEVDNPPNSSSPPGSDIIRLLGGVSTVNTVSFAAPVVNPVMAIVSQGRTTVEVVYDFVDAPFDVISSGPGFFGGGTLTELAGDVLSGFEGHGLIQFQGTFSSISWTAPLAENWHGFTFGIASVAGVPAPATLMLMLAGLAGLAVRRSRSG